MNITELNEYIRINSLQYFVGDDIEVTEEILSGLVKRSINVYGNYRPMLITTRLYIPAYSYKLDSIDGRKITNITSVSYLDRIIDPTSDIDFPWDWNRDSKILRCAFSGNYHIEAMVMPKLEDIDYDQTEFLDLTQGLYMMYVGQTRKGFTLGDLPFENDGSEIYTDGKELYEKTIEQLSEVNSNWYLSIV